MENPVEYGNVKPGFPNRNPEVSAENTEVSAENTEVSVSFGPGTDDIMPVSWASRMLTTLRAEDPARFGKLLTKILTSDAGR
jgi:hypothetical protein